MAESVQRLVTLRIRNVSSDVRRRYLIAGIAGGVVLLAGGLYLALGGDVIEYLIATQALLRFNSADSFADRVAVYHSIPDINVPVRSKKQRGASWACRQAAATFGIRFFLTYFPTGWFALTHAAARAQVPLDPSEHELKNMINTDSPLLLTWLESVESAISSLERSHLLEVRERVRHRLIKEALEMAQLHERVAAIQAVLNPCAEKEALLERELNREFEKGGSGWIDADILEAVCNTDDGGGAQLLGNRLQVRNQSATVSDSVIRGARGYFFFFLFLSFVLVCLFFFVFARTDDDDNDAWSFPVTVLSAVVCCHRFRAPCGCLCVGA